MLSSQTLRGSGKRFIMTTLQFPSTWHHKLEHKSNSPNQSHSLPPSLTHTAAPLLSFVSASSTIKASLCYSSSSSPAAYLPSRSTKQGSVTCFHTTLFLDKLNSCSHHPSNNRHLFLCSSSHLPKDSSLIIVKASETEAAETSKKEDGVEEDKDKYEVYEVVLDQPYGLKFTKGRDGGTYIDAIAPGSNADKTGLFTVGDKILATSAVFGDEIWPAAEYGRTMYTIRQRIGPLLMKMEKRYGKVPDMGDLTEKEIIRAERNAGFISDRIREIQLANAIKKKEQKESRERDLRDGLQLYKSGKYEEALEKFESVLGSRPDYKEASVASYNVACCYSKLNQVQAGLSALEDSLQEGFEDFKRICTDPDLANLRKSEEFEPLLKKYDESFINENAIDAIKSLFGIFKKEQ